MKEFHDEIIQWLGCNGFDNVDVSFELNEFCFDGNRNIINIGSGYEFEVGRLFEQFLYEYGMEYVGFYDPILYFLHELGHYNTVYSFSNEELWRYNFIKLLVNAFEYWEIPDEMAANMWVVDFVNEKVEAVEELCDIFSKYGYID